MPKIVDYEEKRQEIAEKAIAVFVRDGYYHATLSSIAKECGMGRTTLYQYFRDKEDIFLHSVRYIFDSITDDYKQAVENPDLSFLEKIKGIFTVLGSHIKEEKSKMLIIGELNLILYRQDLKEVEVEKNKFTKKLANKFKLLLEEGIKSKQLKDVNTDSMSFTLYTLVKSLIFQPSLSADIDVDDYLSNINLLIDGLMQ